VAAPDLQAAGHGRGRSKQEFKRWLANRPNAGVDLLIDKVGYWWATVSSPAGTVANTHSAKPRHSTKFVEQSP
jgi:hypothetical protein